MTVELTLPTPRPLAGRRIVVTHPADRDDALATRLRALGAVVLSAPSIAFAVAHRDEPSPLDAHLARLEEYDWLIFTSATAVQAVVDRPTWAAPPRSGASSAAASRWPRVAVVGMATAAACRRAGIDVALVGEGGTAEGLVAQLRAAAPGGSSTTPRSGNATETDDQAPRALFPRADIARADLPDGLRAAGWHVDEVVAYRTTSLAPGPDVVAAFAEGVDAVTFASPSAVRALTEGLDAASRERLSGAATVCIGPTTAAEATAAGLTVAAVARQRSTDGFVAAVMEGLAARWTNEGTAE